jgi:hypothetical protein
MSESAPSEQGVTFPLTFLGYRLEIRRPTFVYLRFLRYDCASRQKVKLKAVENEDPMSPITPLDWNQYAVYKVLMPSLGLDNRTSLHTVCER